MDMVKRPLEVIAAISDGSYSHAAFEKMGIADDVKGFPLQDLNQDQNHSYQVLAETKPLQDAKSEQLMLAYDAFLLAIPLALLIKVALVIVAYNWDMWNRGFDVGQVSHLTTFLVRFNSQLSTLFTIAFITIMSTMVRRWALYKAQEGASLAELEQLQSSISLPSTAKMIWSLRRFGALSGGLLFFWSFYYLGSQACQREYLLADSKPLRKTELAMPLANLSSALTLNTGDTDTIESLYQSMGETLTAGEAYQIARADPKPYDAAGNTLVPILESITEYQLGELNTEGKVDKLIGLSPWFKTGDIYSQDYSAYTGPQVWLNYSWTEFGNGNDYYKAVYDDSEQFLGELEFTSQYTYVSCEKPVSHDYSAFPNGTLATSDVSINFTRNDRAYNKDGKPTFPKQFDFWGRWNVTDGAVQTGSFVSLCNLTTSVVDVKADCQSLGCAAKKVRRNAAQLTPSPITPFDNDTFADEFFDRLLISMGPLSAPTDREIPSGVARLLELFVVANVFENPATFTNDSDFRLQDFVQISANNLVTLINTYYDASVTLPNCSVSDTGSLNTQCTYWKAKGAVYNQQYLLSIPWLVVDFCSCFILLAAALFSYWLRTRTIAPDIFGYVSSLTRENPHFNLPTERGSTLSGLERARLLGDIRIKIGEYVQEDGLPRVVVSHVAEGFEAKALNKEEAYA